MFQDASLHQWFSNFNMLVNQLTTLNIWFQFCIWGEACIYQTPRKMPLLLKLHPKLQSSSLFQYSLLSMSSECIQTGSWCVSGGDTVSGISGQTACLSGIFLQKLTSCRVATSLGVVKKKCVLSPILSPRLKHGSEKGKRPFCHWCSASPCSTP